MILGFGSFSQRLAVAVASGSLVGTTYFVPSREEVMIILASQCGVMVVTLFWLRLCGYRVAICDSAIARPVLGSATNEP